MRKHTNKIFKRAIDYCCEDISLIENYDAMINDDSGDMWCIHHKLEINTDYRNSTEDLKMMGLYYNRPACELIFLKQKDHASMHHHHQRRSKFGELYYNKFGLTQIDNIKLYKYHNTWYRRHGYLKENLNG